MSYDIENLITAVDKFNKKNRNIVNLKFIISGDGPKKQKIKKIISNLNSDYIQFMGALSKPQYLSLLQHSSLGILPYIAQSAVDFPAKCYDYIIAGTPMLHSLDGELKVFCKENKCGFYYEPGNVSSLVECLDYLFIKDKINMISSNTSSLSDSYGKETQLENFFKVYTKKYLE